VDFISFVIDSYPAAIGMMLLVSNGVIGTGETWLSTFYF